MLFKNLYIYRMTRPLDLSIEQIEKQLSALTFTPCASQEIAKFGWVSPLGKMASNLTHSSGKQLIICAKKEDKILPSSVVNDLLSDKIENQQAALGRKLYKKEKDNLKEDIIFELLPRAFSKYQQTKAWINLEGNYIAVDAGSARQAEDLLALLRKTLGSLPVVPLRTSTPVEITLTEWLKEGVAPVGLVMEDEAELKSALEHGGIIRAKKQDLLSEEIKGHLDADKLATSLALSWSESISFTLKDDLSIKRIKFCEELELQNSDIDDEDPIARFDADFALVTGELAKLISELVNALGGEDK